MRPFSYSKFVTLRQDRRAQVLTTDRQVRSALCAARKPWLRDAGTLRPCLARTRSDG
jgi:hypothetical protein